MPKYEGLNQIFSEYAQHKSKIYTSNIRLANDFLYSYGAYKNHILKDREAELPAITKGFEDISKETKRRNKKISGSLNVFDIFRPNEVTHSYIVADILNPNGNHGQGNLFLFAFLEQLGIEYTPKDRWVVTAEVGRIDILLKRITPKHGVVVIENKSNYAVDQANQLYRYWHQEIYKPTLSTETNDKVYQLIYLSPATWKSPTNDSISRPKDWDTSLPDKIPMEIKHLIFRAFVVKWLEHSLLQIPKENHRLREYIQQYIEYWS